MGKSKLVSRDEKAGERLTRELLKDSKLGLNAAFWWNNAETEDWKFVVASSLCREAGPRSTYARIGASIARLESGRATGHQVLLSEISATLDTDPTVTAMAQVISIENSTARLTANMLNGVYVHDAVVYHLKSASDAQ